MGGQPSVRRWKAGHSIPGSAGLHLPLLIRSGEWRARFSVFNELLRGATPATETGRTGSSWWWHALVACTACQVTHWGMVASNSSDISNIEKVFQTIHLKCSILSFASFCVGAVHAGSVSQRCDRGQSEPALRALLRPVWLCCSGEYYLIILFTFTFFFFFFTVMVTLNCSCKCLFSCQLIFWLPCWKTQFYFLFHM